jgi:hypothetical protein
MLRLTKRLRTASFANDVTPYVSHLTLRLQLPNIEYEVGVVVAEDGQSYKVMLLGPQLTSSRVTFVPYDSIVDTVGEYIAHLTTTDSSNERDPA